MEDEDEIAVGENPEVIKEARKEGTLHRSNFPPVRYPLAVYRLLSRVMGTAATVRSTWRVHRVRSISRLQGISEQGLTYQGGHCKVARHDGQ